MPPSSSGIGADIGPAGDILVIFGITGDLAKRMTLPSLYRLERRGALAVPVIGVGRHEWSDEDLRAHAREAVRNSVDDVDMEVLKQCENRLSYIQGDYDDEDTYARLKRAMGGVEHPVYYLETPPPVFADVVWQLGRADLTDGARVVLEKPFGHDLHSARELQARLCEVLTEDQIYRIDHFLGKEPVMDITYLRFANSMFEPVWNANYIACVQITMAEDFGVEDRAGFYDGVGALRDVVQNHLLQLLALVAMEPPARGSDPDPIRDRKLDLFKAIPAADPDPKVYQRGQYDGYREIEGVAPDSNTETFAALRLDVENWRWDGVPFYIRAGKKLPTKVTEIRVILHGPPPLGLGGGARPGTDELVLRIDPEAGACILLEAKQPGEDALRRVHLDMLFHQQVGEQPTPYERLITDALRGNPELFSRMDMVEESWRIVQPLIERPCALETYEPGSWGPKSASKLTRRYGGWRQPWLPGQ
ncbi:MAG: glucose-6-phosphate dehydrogenase [Actinomycetota bacterium]|nr:glucose-6-phosphate dehydrogenase [Actinomycetota bacterium]